MKPLSYDDDDDDDDVMTNLQLYPTKSTITALAETKGIRLSSGNDL